jgi:hypothetical protein
MTPSGIDPATFRFVAQWNTLYEKDKPEKKAYSTYEEKYK